MSEEEVQEFRGQFHLPHSGVDKDPVGLHGAGSCTIGEDGVDIDMDEWKQSGGERWLVILIAVGFFGGLAALFVDVAMPQVDLDLVHTAAYAIGVALVVVLFVQFILSLAGVGAEKFDPGQIHHRMRFLSLMDVDRQFPQSDSDAPDAVRLVGEVHHRDDEGRQLGEVYFEPEDGAEAFIEKLEAARQAYRSRD